MAAAPDPHWVQDRGGVLHLFPMQIKAAGWFYISLCEGSRGNHFPWQADRRAAPSGVPFASLLNDASAQALLAQVEDGGLAWGDGALRLIKADEGIRTI